MQAHICPLTSDRSYNLRNRGRQPLPLRRLAVESFLPGLGQTVVLGAPVVLADGPLGTDPTVLFKLMETWVKSALAHLKYVAGDLSNSLGDRPAVHRFERDCFQNEQV